MKRFKALTTIIIILITLENRVIHSQDNSSDPGSPTPRAEPVSPIPRAEPIGPNEPTPRAELAIPKTYPKAVPKLEYTEESDEKPSALIDYANFVYSQKQWTIASTYYLKFLEISPNNILAPLATYRLAETYLKQKNINDAEKFYLKIFEDFTNSEYLGPATYRLGSIYYSNNKFLEAANFFNTAKETLDKKSVQLSATYYHARSLNETKQYTKALSAFEKLSIIENENPYREAALLTIARIYADNNEEKKSINAFTRLIKISEKEDIQAESLVKSGLMSNSLGDTQKAKDYFSSALALQGGEEWKPDAQFHLIKIYYQEKNFQKVIDTYSEGAFSMSDEIRPKMLLMVGNSFRQMDRHKDAISVYILLREHYPSSKEASESEYRKLLSLFNLGNKSLPRYVDRFLEWQRPRNPNHKNIDMAILIKAEHFFEREDFISSGNAYDEIRLSNVPQELASSLLYKKAWSHSESKNATKAITSFTEFIESYPEDKRISNALAKRALNYKSIEDYTSALSDLKKIIEKFQETESAELAYQQIALIEGQRQNYPALISSYQKLLEKYPSSKASAEAYFWIGWGQFELKKFKESSAALREARKLDKRSYHERATLRIILAEYSQQRVEAVQDELESLRQSVNKIIIPPQIYLWLGVNLFDSNNYSESSYYLNLACNPQDPASTQAVVWRYLGQARLFTGEYKKSIEAFDFYLNTPQPSNNKARVLHDKSTALLALKEFKEAEKIVESALSLQPQSRIYGMLCLVWGEIALQQEKYDEAIKRLIKPTYAIEDNNITPTAILKSSFAHDKIGETNKAEELLSKLKSKYPKFKAQTIIPGTNDSTSAAAN
ncbi:MAG: hypothetical protein CMO46_03115 [Verrucomicrobiales bacterium]|nr:hypothetical protein [Verrucomicrobiales bacterium]